MGSPAPSAVAPAVPRARVVATRFGSGGFSAELAQYVRERLRIAVRLLWLVAGAALLLNAGARLIEEGGSPGALIDGEIGVLLAALAIATVADRVLRRPDLPVATISLLDAVLMLLFVVVCVTNYHLDYLRGGGHGVHFLALVMVARAVVVPSTSRRTAQLSAPALPAVFLVQLGHALAGDPLCSGIASTPVAAFSGPWWSGVIWLQAVLGFALGIAVMSSRVTFRLRLRAYEAQRLGPYEIEGLIGSGGMGYGGYGARLLCSGVRWRGLALCVRVR